MMQFLNKAKEKRYEKKGEWKFPLGSRCCNGEREECNGDMNGDCRSAHQSLSIPQRCAEHHQDDHELKNFYFIEKSHVVMILEVFDALLQAVGDLHQLLNSADALDKNAILEIALK